MANDNKSYSTGYKNCKIYVKRESNSFVITSNDPVFLEYYYPERMVFSNREAATTKLDEIATAHALERFSQ